MNVTPATPEPFVVALFVVPFNVKDTVRPESAEPDPLSVAVSVIDEPGAAVVAPV